jgi:hypothetical protein
MKLWLLKPRGDLPENDNPWEPWDHKALGFVVRSEDEAAARRLAHEHAYAENHNAMTPWLDADYSTCEPLRDDGPAMIVMCDVVSLKR